MLNTISPVPKKKKRVFDYVISITKWLPIAILKIFKFDNYGTKQAMKSHNMSNSTIFAMTNPMQLLFFKFEVIQTFKSNMPLSQF